MKFPVDVLAAVSHSELEQRAQSYMRELLYSNPECPEQLTLPDTTKVDISISSVGLVPLYGSCDTQKVLALFAPADPFTLVALYLLDRWWAVGDLLHTADSSRDGLVQVDTLGERIVLYVLNRIVYRVQEMSSDELPFLCHGEQDFAKILWKNGQAVGFYSVKPTGSPCSSFSSRTYPLPVMDSLYVRKCHRGKGLGLRMLEDFVDSFKADHLGLRYPLTTAMYKVCQCYLRAFPGDSELLWEVDSSRFSQRTSISSRIHSMSLRGASSTLTYSESAMSGSVHHTEENVEEITILKTAKCTGPAGQKNTDEQCSTDIRISEEVTLLRLVQNTEVAQTEELLEVTTENGTGIVVTEHEEDTVFHKVPSLSWSQEDSEVTQNLNSLSSSVITVENVASEIQECLHSQVDHTVESSQKTDPPQGTVTMQRVLRTRTVVNIPQLSNVSDVDGDVDKSVDEFGTQGFKYGENATDENQTKNIMEETLILHRMPLRGSITTPKPTRVSMRLKQVERSTVEAGTQKHGPDTEQHESQEIEDTVELTGVCLAAEVENKAEKQEAIDMVTQDKATSEELSKGCIVPEIPPEAEDNDDAESEISQKVLQLAPSLTKEHESLLQTQGETEVVEVVQTRTLRSGARANSAVGTPRMTRSRQQNVKEEIVETTTIKQGNKSTGRKQVSKPKGQTQELEASSAEEDTTDQMSLAAEVGEDWANKDESVNNSQVVTETQDTVSKEDNKDQEPTMVEEDTLHEDNEEEVKGETDITDKETAVVECSSAEVVEKTEEESSTVEVESVLLSTTEAEDTQQTESTMEMDKESQPVIELNTEESGIELEQVSVPEQSDETTPIVETKSLRSGPKTVTATSRCRHAGENQTSQPQMPERPQEESQNEQDTTEEQSKECVALEIPSEVVNNGDAQSETKNTEVEDNDDAKFEPKIAAQVVQLIPSQTKYNEKNAEECPENVSGAAVASEEAPHVVPTEHENLSSSETEKVIETRALSVARPISTVLTPRTTRSNKRKVEEEIVEKTTLKQDKKSTGRKRVSRSKAQSQELEDPSSEEDTTEKVQTDTSKLTTIENNDMSLSTEVDEDGTGKDKPIKDLEPSVSKEESKDQEPALVEEDTLQKEDEEVKSETDITERAVVENSSAKAVEKKTVEEASSADEVESVLLSTTEAEDTQQTGSTMEMDKESKPEAEMEVNKEESGIDKEPEQESVPEQSDETTPVVETRSLRSGPKTVTATPRRICTEENQTAQLETPDRAQEEPQNEQDSTEEQSKESAAPEIPSEIVDNDDAQSETKIATEVVQLIPSQTKILKETPDECPEGGAAVASEEAPPEHENLSLHETEKVIETRALRSGARPISTVLTPRTTRSSKQKVEVVIVEKTTTKRGKKSTGRKREIRSKSQTQEPGLFSADDMTEDLQTDTPGHTDTENNDMSLPTKVDEYGSGKDKPIAALGTTVSNEDSKDQEPELVEQDKLHKENEEVKHETDITEEEAVVLEHSSPEAVDEEKSEKASSAAEVESVLPSATEAEDTQQTENTMEMDKETKPEDEMELNIEESGIGKEPEQESVPAQSDETTPIAETRSLRRGPKTVTPTPRRICIEENLTAQPETPEIAQEEPQNENASTEEQSKACVAPEIPSEGVDNDHAQSKTKIAAEVVQLIPSQTKDPEETPEECPEDVSGTAVASEEAPPVVTTDHENLSSSETEKVIETRALRSGARPISTVLTPRTTRSSKQMVEEVIVEKTTTKRDKKSTGRKRVSRSKEQSKEPEHSSAGDNMPEELQTQTRGHTDIENNDKPLSIQVDEDKAGKAKTTISKEDSKDQESALAEEDGLHKDNSEVKGEPDFTKTAVVEHSSAEHVDEEKSKKASSKAELESVLPSTTEAEDTQQTGNTMEMDKEFKPEAEMEVNKEESGIDKEPEQESVSEQSDKTTSVVQTRSIRSGSKTVTATPRRICTEENQTAQPETPDRAQEEPQNEEDSTEEQSKESVAPEIPSELVANDDAQSENEIAAEVVQLVPSQTKDPVETPEECAEEVSGSAEAPLVVTTEHENLSSSETEKVIETKALRSVARPISTVLTLRTTRSSKQMIEEETVEKTTTKRAKKLTGRNRVGRSKAQTQDSEPSSAEDSMTKEVQAETPGHTDIENNDLSLSTVVDEDGAGKANSKYQDPELVEQDNSLKESEEAKGETDITEEETVVVEHSSAEAVDEEKSKKASSAAELESVLPSTTEADDTQQTGGTMEMEKESKPEAEMEVNIEESGIDKEPEQESVPEQSDKTTPIVETISLTSGSKTVTATPRRICTEENQTTQPEKPDGAQEKAQNEQHSTEEQSKESVAPEIPSELVDNDDAQSETKITAEVIQLIPSQSKDPKEIPEECPEYVSDPAVACEEAPPVVTNEHENLSSSEIEKVVETRALRSGSRPISTVLTPRTTRSSKRKVEEVIVEKTTTKRDKKSTGRKRVSRSKEQSEEPEHSSAEDNMTEELQTQTPGHTDIENNDKSLSIQVDEDKAGKDKTTISKEVSKHQESALAEEDTLHKDNSEVKGETDLTKTVVVEHSSAEDVDEEKTEEASSTAEVESILLSTTEAENTQQIESTMEMDKESKPEAEMEVNIEESSIGKEPEQESVPEQSHETTPIVETRSLRSGRKTVTATPRRICTEENQTAQPETPDRAQEEPQNEQDSTEEQSKESVAPEIPSELVAKDDAQSENEIAAEVVHLVPSQTKDPVETPEECAEEVSGSAEAPLVVTTEHENLSSSETEKVIETRALRSVARPISTVLTPRTTRSSKRMIEEETVEKTTTKRAKKLTGRNRVSRSKSQTQDSEPSSAEDSMTKEVQAETPGHIDIENNDLSLSAVVDEDGAGKDKPTRDLETTVSKEDSKYQDPELVEQDNSQKESEEAKGETDITKEEIVVVEHSSAEAVDEEKSKKASSVAELESVLPSTTEAEDTQQTGSIMEMDKESKPEAEMEVNIEESGIDKEPEQESIPEQSDKTTPIVETISLTSGSKTVTATPRRICTEENQTTQPEKPDEAQEKAQNEQHSTEEQSKESVAPEIPSELVDNDDAQSETKITAEVIQLIPSQSKDPKEIPEECPEYVSDPAVACEEAPPVVTNEHENLSSSEIEKVVETRALRSGSRPISTVLTPRTTRSSKRKVEEVIVEKTTTKRDKKSTGRKRVSRSKEQSEEPEHSSAEDNMTEELQTQTPGHTDIENNDKSLSIQVDEDKAGKVVQHSSAEAVDEASSAAKVESVLHSTTDAEDTQQTERTMEMDKESKPEPEMEVNIEESGIDKEPEQESVSEQSDKTTSIVEARSLRSGPKTVRATPRLRHTGGNQAAKPVTPNRPQEEPLNEQDSTESKEGVAPEIPSEVVENDDAQSEIKIISEVPLLDLPRVAVVLVDVQKVQVVKSINEIATSEQQDGMTDREDNCIQGDEYTVKINQQEQVEEVEMDLAEGPQDHIDSQVPVILENADSSFNGTDDKLTEEASLISPANLCTEDLETPVTPSSKTIRQSDIQHKQAKVEDFQKVSVKAHDPEVQKTKAHSCQTPRRSSRKRARVNYRDGDDQSESLTSEDISKDTLTSRRFCSEPQSEEEETSEGFVLSLRLDEEEEQSASDEELVIITGKNLRSRSVPSIIISPHPKPTHLHSTVPTPKQSPEQTPRQTRRSAKASPCCTSKRPRK